MNSDPFQRWLIRLSIAVLVGVIVLIAIKRPGLFWLEWLLGLAIVGLAVRQWYLPR
jgi:hypothetical protein